MSSDRVFDEGKDKGNGDQADEAILEVVREVSDELGISRVHCHRILWGEEGTFDADNPMFLPRGILGLSKEMKGKLSPGEWKPLVASSLLFRQKSRPRTVVYVVLSLVVSAVLAYLLFLLSAALLAFAFFSTFFVYYVFAVVTAPYMKNLRLESDRAVARNLALGANFAQVLEKIVQILGERSYSIGGHRKASWGKLPPPPPRRPTIARRIESLSLIDEPSAESPV